MAQNGARRAFEPATLRSVFIKVQPAPRRLSERRAILRTLQRYGEIEMFQSLTRPDAFSAIATKALTVKHLVANSPLQFDYVPEPTTADQESTTGGVPRDIHSLHKAMDRSDSRQSFMLSVFPSDTEHRYQIQKSPLYGPWPENRQCGPVKSFATEALRQLLPNDMAAKGLRDWDTGGQTLKMFDRGYGDKASLADVIVQRRIAQRQEREVALEKRARGNLLQTLDE